MTRELSQEFKSQVVELHRGGRSFMDLAREFDLSATTVSNWVRVADKKAAGSASGESDKAKIARLERELAERTEELEVLGKALAFFARRAR